MKPSAPSLRLAGPVSGLQRGAVYRCGGSGGLCIECVPHFPFTLPSAFPVGGTRKARQAPGKGETVVGGWTKVKQAMARCGSLEIGLLSSDSMI